MSRSNYIFNRWKPRVRTSWAWRVFKKHNIELLRMFTAFDNCHKFTYKSLQHNGANWEDLPTKHFTFPNSWEKDNFGDMRDWSKAFNDLHNWTNLNALVTITSAFETYLATVIPLALESDVGVLYGTPRRIDGIEILKHSIKKPFEFEKTIESCTKGTWQSRLNTYERLFGTVPKYVVSKISELEKIRVFRNKIAHSFGRDIEASRKIGELAPLPIEKISRKRLLNFQQIIWKSAKAIDVHLHNFHIGEYQALLFYHELYPSLNHNVHIGIRAMDLKKAIGRHGELAAGKIFCKGLVAYYEQL